MDWIVLLLLFVVTPLLFGAFVFSWAWKQMYPSTPTKPVPASPTRASSPMAMAKELPAEFDGSPPTDVVWDRSEQAGLDVVDVARAVDAILREADAKVESITIPEDLIDLRDIEAVRMHVKGTSHYLSESERRFVGGTQYVLIPEPRNEHDPNAIEVFDSDWRKVGYVAASRAAMLAPLFAQLGAGGYRVSGDASSGYDVKLWVDVPKVPALRAFVKDRACPSKLPAKPARSSTFADCPAPRTYPSD